MFLFHCILQIGTFTTQSGEYFLEPLMTADEEEYKEEHNKPHLVYKYDSKKKQDRDTSEPCASSGNGQSVLRFVEQVKVFDQRSIIIKIMPSVSLLITLLW